MKATLAGIVIALVLMWTAAPVRGQEPTQQEPPSAQPQKPDIPESATPQAAPPQTPPPQSSTPAASDCDKSKDTCELPAEPPQQAPATSATPTEPAPAVKETKPAASAAPKKSATKKTKKKKRRKTTVSSTAGPRKVVVRDGGTSEPDVQLSPAVPKGQAGYARQTTDQLLTSTQTNLKTVSGRTLNPNQQATVDQIKMFVEQANSALKEGDLQRGHNLAMKAHLLSEDLARH